MPISETILHRLKENDSTLTELDLTRRYPQLTDGDIEQLADALQNNKKLKTLILSEDGIQDCGVRILARALLTTNVTELDLSGNHISDEGARALFKMPSLTSLIINGNDIGNQGIAEIGENTTIRTLIIDGNNIGGEGIKAFLNNKTITELVFDHDEMDPVLVEQMRQHIWSNAVKQYFEPFLAALRALPPEQKGQQKAQQLRQEFDAALEEARPSGSYSPKLYS